MSLYRALVEGIALGFRSSLAVAEERGTRFSEVVAVDGAGRSALPRQTLADALGLPLTWIPDASGTLVGAAALAAIGTGIVANARATREWRLHAEKAAGDRRAIRHMPRDREHAVLSRVFELRSEIYSALKPTFRKVVSPAD